MMNLTLEEEIGRKSIAWEFDIYCVYYTTIQII